MTPHALIIDDNEANVDVLALMLAQQGVGYTALTLPRHLNAVIDQLEHVDLIFLDLEFPNHDGMAMCAELQADPRLAGVPVVAYTVHTSALHEIREAGFHSFLGKPLNGQRFPDQIQRLLSGEAVWDLNH
jgi:two-component system, cell cycle response regulator DivK